MAPFEGGTFIADSSAWAHLQGAGVRRRWRTALANGQIATTPMVTLEILYSARDGADFDVRAGDLARLRDIPLTRSVTNAAQGAHRELAHRHPLFHRSVKIPDLLIAAAAQEAGIGVLHYDEDYDTLATVLEFESRWIARKGSLA